MPAVVGKLSSHLERQCLGEPLFPLRTVKDIVQIISSFQGGFIAGDPDTAFVPVADNIAAMCKPPPVVGSGSVSLSALSVVEAIRIRVTDMVQNNIPTAEIDDYVSQELRKLGVSV